MRDRVPLPVSLTRPKTLDASPKAFYGSKRHALQGWCPCVSGSTLLARSLGGLPRFTSGLGAKFMRFRATRSIDEGLEGLQSLLGFLRLVLRFSFEVS